jgi:hypothetical protein
VKWSMQGNSMYRSISLFTAPVAATLLPYCYRL